MGQLTRHYLLLLFSFSSVRGFVLDDFRLLTLAPYKLWLSPSSRAGSSAKSVLSWGSRFTREPLSTCRFHNGTALSSSWIMTNGCQSLWGRQGLGFVIITPLLTGANSFNGPKVQLFSLPGRKIKCTLRHRGCSVTHLWNTVEYG